MGEDKNKDEFKLEEGQIWHASELLTQEIYDHPETIIEIGVIDACKKLWDLNIFTIESNGHGGKSWVKLMSLDEENKQIFEEFAVRYPKNYEVGSTKNNNDFMIRGDGEYLSPALIEGFAMQDVPVDAYKDEEDFLIINGNYAKYELSSERDGSLITTFDSSKLTDTIENTVIFVMKEKGIPLHLYVPEEHRIYENEYCLNAHKKYIRALQKGEIVKSTEHSV